MAAAALATYCVEAVNTAKVSENKIHDDEVARRFGFGGGLVPGVDVYAYMAHLPVVRWGAPGSNVAPPSAGFKSPFMMATSPPLPRPRLQKGLICASRAMVSCAPSAAPHSPIVFHRNPILLPSRRFLPPIGRRRAKPRLQSALCSASARC
jgi:hypothetical protein